MSRFNPQEADFSSLPLKARGMPLALSIRPGAGLLLLVALSGSAFIFAPLSQVQAAPVEELPALCARLGNDDTIRPYSPSLRNGTVRAFKVLYPDAKGDPADNELETEANFRCMNGKVLVCFVGANLPCAKMNTARENAGANEFCRSNPDANFVGAAATGHDTVYSYRCRDGRAEVDAEIWELDERGFAKKLWVEISN
jgi:hypothetical protein